MGYYMHCTYQDSRCFAHLGIFGALQVCRNQLCFIATICIVQPLVAEPVAA
jgi:hypothetical protein